MSKRISFGAQFQKLNDLKKLPPARMVDCESSLDECKAPAEAKISIQAPQPVGGLDSLNTEERLPSVDSIQNEQCQNLTVSKIDTVEVPQEEALAPVENYTRISNHILRTPGYFSDPVDFMVYFHLYSYSYGFGRKTASMSQAQLERFTSSSKNTIKRSLDRLVSDGWIKLVDDYEHGRVSRTWKVFLPEDRKPSGRVNKGNKADSVQNGQCSEFTGRVSNFDTLTVSKMDTYKERRIKENTKTLSLTKKFEISKSVLSERELPENLKIYLDELRPERKRLSEWQSFQSLFLDYSVEQVSDALAWVRANGVPGSGESCHSPLAFLASGAIQRVMGLVREVQEKQAQIAAKNQAQVVAERVQQEKEMHEAREAAIMEAAFCGEFPTQEKQLEAIRDFCQGMPFSLVGQTARVFAMGRWWDSLNKIERLELSEGVVVSA